MVNTVWVLRILKSWKSSLKNGDIFEDGLKLSSNICKFGTNLLWQHIVIILLVKLMGPSKLQTSSNCRWILWLFLKHLPWNSHWPFGLTELTIFNGNLPRNRCLFRLFFAPTVYWKTRMLYELASLLNSLGGFEEFLFLSIFRASKLYRVFFGVILAPWFCTPVGTFLCPKSTAKPFAKPLETYQS